MAMEYLIRRCKRMMLRITAMLATGLWILIPIWLVTFVLVAHAYRFLELNDRSATSTVPARVTHYAINRGVITAYYVFSAPASASSVEGKGRIGRNEASALANGLSKTVDIDFRRDKPQINAPSSSVLDDSSSDELLAALFVTSLSALTAALVRKAIKMTTGTFTADIS